MAARVRLQMEARRKKLEERRQAQLRAADRGDRAGGGHPGLQREGGAGLQKAGGGEGGGEGDAGRGGEGGCGGSDSEDSDEGLSRAAKRRKRRRGAAGGRRG